MAFLCFITERYHDDPIALEQRLYAKKLNKPFILVIIGDVHVDESFFSTVNVIDRICVPKDTTHDDMVELVANRTAQLMSGLKKDQHP